MATKVIFKKMVLASIAVLWGLNFSLGQTCAYTDLSNQFDLKVDFKRIKEDSGIVIISIREKSSGITRESIKYGAGHLFDDVFKRCESVRSYQTYINDSVAAEDNYYGDLIVADFNFDGLDDIAVISNGGGNGGPVYNFYTQEKNGRFYFDKFLSNTVRFFPSKIDGSRKVLITYVHANAYEMGKTVYQYNDKAKTWFTLRHEFVDYSQRKR